MLSITVDSTKGAVPIQFEWKATSEEFQLLYDHLEEMAADKGHSPADFAGKAIYMMATDGEPYNHLERRGQRMWIVYAVLRYAADNIDLGKMVDLAGVITGTPTVFDLAEHQHIKATMRLRGKDAIEMAVTGASALDS